MRLLQSVVLFALALVSEAQRQTLQEAAVDARRLVATENEGTLLSVFQESVAPKRELVGSPIGVMEYVVPLFQILFR